MPLNIRYQESFEDRHNGQQDQEFNEMLEAVGVSSISELIDQTVPASIRLANPLNLPPPQSESQFLVNLKKIAGLLSTRLSKTIIHILFELNC